MAEILSLRQAIEQNRVDDFIRQEEARGVGSIDRAKFNASIAALIKAPQSEDQTSRSPSGDGSTGKRTRLGSGPRIPH
jgi:hypothetical protein